MKNFIETMSLYASWNIKPTFTIHMAFRRLGLIHENGTMPTGFQKLLQQKNHNCNGKSNGSPCKQAIISLPLNPWHGLLQQSRCWSLSWYRAGISIQGNLRWFLLNYPVSHSWIWKLICSSYGTAIWRIRLSFALPVGGGFFRSLRRVELRNWGWLA